MLPMRHYERIPRTITAYLTHRRKLSRRRIRVRARVRVKVSDYVTYLTNPKLPRIAWVRVRVAD